MTDSFDTRIAMYPQESHGDVMYDDFFDRHRPSTYSVYSRWFGYESMLPRIVYDVDILMLPYHFLFGRQPLAHL